MTSAEQVLGRVLYEIVGYSGPIDDGLTPAAVPGWDSVAHINIVEELESRLNVRFSTNDMIAMTSVRAIKDVLERHKVG